MDRLITGSYSDYCCFFSFIDLKNAFKNKHRTLALNKIIKYNQTMLKS